ncbi:hypothetical protein BH11BAC2_BH11BAC2_11630 [soil metagenome]
MGNKRIRLVQFDKIVIQNDTLFQFGIASYNKIAKLFLNINCSLLILYTIFRGPNLYSFGLWHVYPNRVSTNKLITQNLNDMKKILILLVTAASFTGCTNYTAQIDQLKHEKDSVLAVSNEKEIQLNEFVATVTEVEGNLSSITEKQGVIRESMDKNPEHMKNAKDRINAEIAQINRLMEESKTQMAGLDRKLKNSRTKATKLEKLVASLNEQLVAKDAELTDLNSKLQNLSTEVATLNTTVTTLTADKTQQAALISDQTTKLHTAYVAVGTYKQLYDKKVVQKHGGVLGIGSEQQLKSDASDDAFSKIDITQTQTFAINSKDVKVVTTHPADSYRMVMTGDNKEVASLEITDPEKFWKTSKYLVVVKD